MGSTSAVAEQSTSCNRGSSALDVLEELDPETSSVTRTLDQAWDVGNDEIAVLVDRHDSQARLERGERIGSDLGASARDDRQQGRLAGVGQTDQSDLSDQLETQAHPTFLTGLPRFGCPRRTIDG